MIFIFITKINVVTFPYMKVKDLADLSLPDIIGLIMFVGVPTLQRQKEIS